jgi:hypothetical protein
MPNVSTVEIAVGGDFHQADIVRRARFELSPAMAFEGYAKHRRDLHQSAIGSLPVELQQRPEPIIGLGRPLTL